MKYVTLPLLLFVVTSHVLYAQQPAISDFNPKYAGSGVQILINGSGFSSTANQNIVYFGGVRATVDSSSATSIYTKVPACAQEQKISVTVNGVAAFSSTVFKLLPGNCYKGFYPASGKDIPNYLNKPEVPRIADIDLDGKPDILSISKNSSSVKLYVIKNGLKTGQRPYSDVFTERIDSFTVPALSGYFIVADIDHDGKTDVLVPGLNSSSFVVMRNTSSTGNISFASPVSVTASFDPVSIMAADFNSDGKTDVVIGSADLTPKLEVFKNLSTPGTISFSSAITLTLSGKSGQIDADDLDNDGKIDIAVAATNAGTVSLFRNTSTAGNFSFGAITNLNMGAYPLLGLRIADFNRDGKKDMVTTAPTGVTAYIIKNNTSSPGNFSFSLAHTLSSGGPEPRFPEVADFNGDSLSDLLFPCYNGTGVYFIPNTSSSAISFGNITYLHSGMNPNGVAVGDLNGDDLMEAVCINNTYYTGFGTSIRIVTNDYPRKAGVTNGGTKACPGSPLWIYYYMGPGGNFSINQGDSLQILLCDSIGSLQNYFLIGKVPAKITDSFSITLPDTPIAVPGKKYRIRIWNPNSETLGCTPSFPIEILKTFNAYLLSNDTTVCKSDTVYIAATGATQYIWQGIGFYYVPGHPNNDVIRLNYIPDSIIVRLIDGSCETYDTVRLNVIGKNATAGTDVATCLNDSVQLNAGGGLTYHWYNSSTISDTTVRNPWVKPQGTSTNYTVVIANGTCKVSDVVKVTAQPRPTMSAGADMQACFGTAKTLMPVFNSQSGLTYIWSPFSGLSSPTSKNPSANPLVSTFYTLTLSINGCSVRDTMFFRVDPLPPTPVIQSAGSLLSTQTFGNNVQWLKNGNNITGATDSFYMVTSAGNYYARLINQFGCTATSSAVYVNPTSVSVLNSTMNIMLYPNPATNSTKVFIPGMSNGESYIIKVLSCTGAQWKQWETTTNETELDLSGISKGIYIISVSNSAGTSQHKLVVE